MPTSQIRRVAPLAALGFLAFVGSPAMAQEFAGLVSGTRVRVWTREPNSERRIGTLAGLRGDTLMVLVDGDADTTRLASSAVTRIDASDGRRSHVITGLMIGAAAGGTIGYFMGKGLDNTSVCGSGCGWLVAGPMAGAGGILGALLGAVTRTERWKEVTHERVSVGIVPRDRRMGLLVSIFF